MKIQKRIEGGGWVGVGGRVEGGQAGCERRIEVFVKIRKKQIFFFFFFFWGGGPGGQGWGVELVGSGLM